MSITDNILSKTNQVLSFRDTESTEPPKFGTFNGVFLPPLLTIMGAVMYLRTGWMVGNAGLGGAVMIILLANFITIYILRCPVPPLYHSLIVMSHHFVY